MTTSASVVGDVQLNVDEFTTSYENGSVVVDSTTVTVSTTTPDLGGLAQVIEAESTEIVSSDASGFSSNAGIVGQQSGGAAATTDVSIAQSFESASSQPAVVYGLDGCSQTVDSVQTDDSIQLINQLQSTSIAQSPGNPQEDVYFHPLGSVPATTSFQSFDYTQSNVLPPQTEPQAAYTHSDSCFDATGQYQPDQQSQQSTYYQNGTSPPPPMDQDPQPVPSSQAVQDPQSGPHSLLDTLKQSTELQEPKPASSSPNLQNSQTYQPSHESTNAQNSVYQQPVMYPGTHPVSSSQMLQETQLVPPTQESLYSQNSSYLQSRAYEDPRSATLDQTLQNPPSGGSNQDFGYSQNNTYQDLYYQNPQESSFPQSFENPQSTDSSASNIEAQAQGYNDPNVCAYSTPATITTDYSLLADNGNPSLGSGLDQQSVSNDQANDGSEELGNGVFSSDAGAEDGDDGGSSFMALVSDENLPELTLNPTALVNAGTGIANSAAIAMNGGAGIAQKAANAMSGINPTAVIKAGVGVANMANAAANAMSDPVTAFQTGVGVAMSGVRIAASIGTWNEARQRRKDSAAQFAAVNGPVNPAVNSQVAIATQFDEILLVLSVLGQRLVVLEVVNLAELPQALAACRMACGQADSGDLLAHFDTLDGTLQYTVTVALFFCAACFPMHIYRGFGTGVLDNFLWGCPHPQYAVGQIAGFKSVDRTIAFLKSMPREVQLLTRIPAGLSRFVPTFDKSDRVERRKLMNAHKEFVREVEKQGHPPPRDGSFRVVSWHFPFATWISPFTFKNSGHFFEDFLRWQMDAGRLLHAWTIGGHLDLMHGEMMWLPSGVAETLARWLVGLPGTTFMLVPSSAFNYNNLKLSPATRKTMFEQGFETMKAVRDPQADFRKPAISQNILVPAPPALRKRNPVPPPQQNHQSSVPEVSQAMQSSQPKARQPVSQPESHRSMNSPQMPHPFVAHQQMAHRSNTAPIPAQQLASNPAASPVASPPIATSPSASETSSTPYAKPQSPASSPATPNSEHVIAHSEAAPVPRNTISSPMARPGLASHQTAPQYMSHYPPSTSTTAAQARAQSTVSNAMATYPSQQRTSSMPNVLAPSPYSQPMNPQTMVPQPTHQQYQPPPANQRPVSAMQMVSPLTNQPQTQFLQGARGAYNTPSSLQHSMNNPHAQYLVGSRGSDSAQFSTMPAGFANTGPSNMQPLSRKSTNASRLSSAGNPGASTPNRLPSNPLPRIHSPSSSVSRTSTISSQHSSSSYSSAPSNVTLASSFTSPPAPAPITSPGPIQAQHHSHQATKTFKRRPVPPPPPPPPVEPVALRQVKAIHDFAPVQDNELGFKTGDVLDVLDDSSEDGWWEARLGGRVGAIPGSYVGDV